MSSCNEETSCKTDNAAESGGRKEPEGIAKTLFELAGPWVSYGLNAARLALETNAKMLDRAAKILQDVSNDLKKPEAR